ncbi:hypothetical protein KUF71_004066 [Frankliniella fusca]|uniref:Uncharacterized protein n=1 Tax=Frankliniella fusca TaxID=407009 RepID=A0AAE1L9S5_9NEOP|nr:hypothetical protein KUF71_004066 [Frankliniella fusca]
MKRAARNAKQIRLEGRDKSVSSTTASTSSSPNDFDTYFEEKGDGDEEDAPPPSKVKVKASADDDDVKLPVRFTKSQKTVSQTRLDLSETAVVGQRYGLSLRATAHVSSSVLLAAGIISPEASVKIKETLVIDKNKIKRENDKVGSKLKQEARNEDAVRGLYFDGRKDEILTSSGFEKEEHISLVSERGSKYIGHVAPTSSSALDARDSIYQYVTRELNCGFDEVVVYREVVNSTIQTNAFFAMPENLLLGMVTDSRLTVRQDALTKILQAKQETQLTTVRFNIVPKIDFEANDYTDMIKWDQTDVSLTLPPVLMHIPEDELTCKLSMADGLVPDWEFTSFPCDTVAVERTVKLVTEVSKRVIGPDARDRQIRSTLLSRKAVPSFGSKKDFVGAIDDKKS